MEALTPGHVQAALDALHLGITIHLFPHSTATAPLAAEAIGCEVGQIAKSRCFVVQGHPILVIAAGDQRVDDRKLATLLGVTRKAVTFATPDQCVEHFGSAPGSVPPVGIARSRMRCTSMTHSNATPRFTQPVVPTTPFLASRSPSSPISAAARLRM